MGFCTLFMFIFQKRSLLTKCMGEEASSVSLSVFGVSTRGWVGGPTFGFYKVVSLRSDRASVELMVKYVCLGFMWVSHPERFHFPSPVWSSSSLFSLLWFFFHCILHFLILRFDPPTDVSLLSCTPPLVSSLSSPFCILTLCCVYWGRSVSPLSLSPQLCVQASFCAAREGGMKRRAYCEEQWGG